MSNGQRGKKARNGVDQKRRAGGGKEEESGYHKNNKKGKSITRGGMIHVT